MPKLVSEISSGQQFQRSQDENGIADSQTRIFRILLSNAGEVFNIQEACGVKIGDQHPYNTNIYCRSFSANFEGDSRMVVLVTFQYQTQAGSNKQEDPQQQPPDIRPANWSTSTSLIEAPAYSWKLDLGNDWVAPTNPVGDIYDGVTRLVPVTTITIEQYVPDDPTKHSQYAGKVNEDGFRFGSLFCLKRTVMFRGVSSAPAVEAWGDLIFRGWKATYEFAYRPNNSKWHDGTQAREGDVGWDVLVPVSGFNVRAFTPPGGASDDQYGQPLKHSAGRIGFDNGVPVLPIGVADGDKVRGMIKVHEYEDGGVSQTPSAQPIPLNMDGRPRLYTADPKVIVRRYQVQQEMDFNLLELRLTQNP